jgi:hypothetical protein
MRSRLTQVHITHEAIASEELSPPHPPRAETPLYRRTHHRLVVEEDRPCAVCGVRQSTLSDPAQNPYQATQLETHHYPIERSLLEACDWKKVAKAFPEVTSQEALEEWVDSEQNMLILCDVHHRSLEHGIHHLLVADWAVLPFLIDGYQVAATKQDAIVIERANEALLEADHHS